MPPVGEIILDLQGREVRKTVTWDRIPLYCQECKHVGHSSDVCYANGKREKPVRMEYKLPVDKRVRQGVGEDSGDLGMGAVATSGRQDAAERLSSGVEKGDGLGQGVVKEQGGGGFQQHGKRRGKQGKGAWDAMGLKEGSPGKRGLGGFGGSAEYSLGSLALEFDPRNQEGGQGSSGGLAGGGGCEGSPLRASENRFSVLSSLSLDSDENSLGSIARDFKSQLRYLKMLPNGDFDPEVYEDEKDWDDEEDTESESEMQHDHFAEKEGLPWIW